jgi:hypothetical protein
MGCRLRDHVRTGDERRRIRQKQFHDALSALLAVEEIGTLPPQTLGRLRDDLERLDGLRDLLADERLRRRELLRTARDQQRTSGCSDRAIRRAA